MKQGTHTSLALAFVLAVTQCPGISHGETPATVTKKTKATVDSKDTKESKQVKMETPEPKSEWQLRLAAPIWIAGISGDVGVRGINANVKVGAGTILKKLDSTFSFAAEVRKGRFGVYADVLYLNLSDSTAPINGVVLGGATVRMDQYLADFDLNYRLAEGDRGWVDALVGFRFTSISEQMNLYPNVPVISQDSTALVNTVSSDINADVRSIVAAALDPKLAALQTSLSDLPNAPISGPQKRLLEDEVTRIIGARQGELAAAITANDTAKIAAIKSQLTQSVSNSISSILRMPVDRTDAWVDPYVGFRARLNLSKAFYLTAKTDIGGFDVSSKIAFEAYGALGCQLTKNIFAEAGYKYLYDDYDSNGFLYKVSTQGAEITVGINF